MNEPNISQEDLVELGKRASEQAAFEARNSAGYVKVMADIVFALNQTEINQLKQIDLSELRNHEGHLGYFHFKHLDAPVPLDIEYFQRLHTHLRRPLMLKLKQIRQRLLPEDHMMYVHLLHCYELGNREEYAYFNPESSLEQCLAGMESCHKLADMAHGRTRKLDLLGKAFLYASHFRFDANLFLMVLTDRYHIHHRHALAQAYEGSFRGDCMALAKEVRRNLHHVDQQCGVLQALMEEITGLAQMGSPSSSEQDSNWYSLGKKVGNGQRFIDVFKREGSEQKLRRMTLPMVQSLWHAGYLTSKFNQIMVKNPSPRSRCSELAKLFFHVQDILAACTTRGGKLDIVLEGDRERDLITAREYNEARAWNQENVLRLYTLQQDIYAQLQEMDEAEEQISVPLEIEKAIADLKLQLEVDRKADFRRVIQELSALDPSGYAAVFDELKPLATADPTQFIRKAVSLREVIAAELRRYDPKDIGFLKRLRDACSSFTRYEERLIGILEDRGRLDALRCECELLLQGTFRQATLTDLSEQERASCLEVVVSFTMYQMERLELDHIDAARYRKIFEDTAGLAEPERICHLDLLLQEINACPHLDLLLRHISEWKKDFTKERLAGLKQFVTDNDRALNLLRQELRNTLRDLLGESGLTQVRLRFEVFGMSDYLADNLQQMYGGLLSMIPRLSHGEDARQLLDDVCNLEAHVIMAQQFTRAEGPALKKLEIMKGSSVISAKLAEQLRSDLVHNMTHLDALLKEIARGQERILKVQERFGQASDAAYLAVILNHEDLVQLQKVYHFHKELDLQHLKRFCIAHNTRNTFVQDFLLRALKKDASIPEEIRNKVDKSTLNNFNVHHFLSQELLISLNLESEDILEATCRLLCYTLNFVRPGDIREKAVYKSIIGLLQRAGTVEAAEERQIGVLWGRIQKRLFQFKPEVFAATFDSNRNALMRDAEACKKA